MRSYMEIALVKKQTPIFFREFGSYQGDWLLVAKDNDNYYIYKDRYGSCSGCDSLQAEEPVTPEEDLRFSSNYTPYLIMTKEEFEEICSRNELTYLLPVNIDYDEDKSIVASEIENIIFCLGEKATAKDIVKLRNAELLRECLEEYGIERFIDELEMKEVDEDEGNKLYVYGDGRYFLLLKDSSTIRSYLLEIEKASTVREGIAWSFRIQPDYVFEQES